MGRNLKDEVSAKLTEAKSTNLKVGERNHEPLSGAITDKTPTLDGMSSRVGQSKEAKRGKGPRNIETAKTNQVVQNTTIGKQAPTMVDLRTSKGSESQSMPHMNT